jgi:hypothetical protein
MPEQDQFLNVIDRDEAEANLAAGSPIRFMIPAHSWHQSGKRFREWEQYRRKNVMVR